LRKGRICEHYGVRLNRRGLLAVLSAHSAVVVADFSS